MPYTRLTVRSGDTPGFLFAFTNALAGFTINIERAEIRTEGGEAVDTFWVTDVAGEPGWSGRSASTSYGSRRP